MRSKSQTNVTFAILAAISLGLGACAAHKRDSVATVREARSAQAAQAATWASVLSSTNKGTYQLATYNLKIVKNAEGQPVLAEVNLESSPILQQTTLPFTLPVTPVTVIKGKDTKDGDLTDVLNKIPKIANEFSAVDGTISTFRSDLLDLKTGDKSQYEEAIKIDQGSGKVSDDNAWGAPVLVKKRPDGSVEIDRIAALDDSKTLMTKEVLVYNLVPPATAADLKTDVKTPGPVATTTTTTTSAATTTATAATPK